MKKLSSFLKENSALLLITLAYILWALAFIFHSSYAASDGRRYFNLFDDAMISMRYAWNFAHGRGLVWNAGEYVEGYTNLLMTLLMSAASFFLEKRYAVLFIQLTGIFFALGAAFFAAKILKEIFQNKHRALLFALVLLYYPLNFWSLMGMETGLLAFLLAAGVYASMQYEKTLQTKYLWQMSAALGLAHLARNESILMAAFAFACLLPACKKNWRAFFLAGGLYSLFVLAQLVFRYFYYGELVPNTYTLKLVGMTLSDRLQNGIGFITPYLKETGILLFVVLAGVFFKPFKHKLYLFGFFVIALFYQIYVGGDAWNYWRMMTPALPFLYVIAVSSLSDFARTFPPAGRLALAVFSLATVVSVNARFAREFALMELPYQNNYAHAHVETAIALNELTDEDATIGVFWAGSLPYYLDRYAIDFLGKSDKYVANLPPDMSGQSAGFGMTSIPGHNKYDLTYSIQTLLPTYVEEFNYGAEQLEGWAHGYYVRVKYGKAKLYLLKDSPNVKWDKVKDYLEW